MKNEKAILDGVQNILESAWNSRACNVVPDATTITLDNDAGEFEGAVLYADMARSSELVYQYNKLFAARIYKVFLFSICEVIRNNNGVITSFDGDRVMAVFIGDCKCSDAAKTALQIRAIIAKVNEELYARQISNSFKIDYAVGVDVSNLFVIKTGIWGSNYLAWIGDAANVAAKMSEIRDRACHSFITERLYKRLNANSKYGDPVTKARCMWDSTNLKIQGQQVYESNWRWNFQ